MVRFGLDYTCEYIIILAEISSVNLLPIQAIFVTERVKGSGIRAVGSGAAGAAWAAPLFCH